MAEKTDVISGSETTLEEVARSIGSTIGRVERRARTIGKQARTVRKKVTKKAEGMSKAIRKEMAGGKAVKQRARRLVKRLAGQAKSAIRSVRRKRKRRTGVGKNAKARRV